MEARCDVILLNLSMPLQDSLVTVALLRSKLPHVKIVGFSASMDLGNRASQATGFDAVLTNQDGLSELVATLKALMPERPLAGCGKSRKFCNEAGQSASNAA